MTTVSSCLVLLYTAPGQDTVQSSRGGKDRCLFRPQCFVDTTSQTIRRIYNKAIYFVEMSVLFETGELNAYVHDGSGLYRRKYVRTEGKGRTTTIALADGKLLPCIATRE